MVSPRDNLKTSAYKKGIRFIQNDSSMFFKATQIKATQFYKNNSCHKEKISKIY